VSEHTLQHMVKLLAKFADSARLALESVGAGLHRCDGRPRPAAAVPYARTASPTATAAARAAARLRSEQRETSVAEAQLLVAADPRLIALHVLLRPGALPSSSYPGLLRTVLALRRSDGPIGATQVPPTTDVLDAALLASDMELGLQARTRHAAAATDRARHALAMHAHTRPPALHPAHAHAAPLPIPPPDLPTRRAPSALSPWRASSRATPARRSTCSSGCPPTWRPSRRSSTRSSSVAARCALPR